ncbi:interferon-induced transmembrane protein 3-like [Colossoma macropomum]|uniref:interferon-induced transmembrane protein 3-like n=1 Tax=Colossoma macropomum TaxID=42526 RepID=UPI001864615D|nr:interferon-induced transmembrane protein 3-like [Colossoma macropomum]
MQSSYRPPENFPLQGGARDRTVVISMPEHPKDYIVWSMASLYFGNPFCLGLLAFYFSIKSRDRKVVGDLAGARAYGSTACCINGWALALIILTIIIAIIVVVVTMSAVTRHFPSHSPYY